MKKDNSNKELSNEAENPAFLVGAVIGGFTIVREDMEFKFKELCPYCRGNLYYTCNGWEQDKNGLWMADSFDMNCSNEPDDMESDEWEEWLNNHSDMPYVIQLPVDTKVKAYVNKRYRFDVK